MKHQSLSFLQSHPSLFWIAKRTHGWYVRLGARRKWHSLQKQPVIKLELGSGRKKGQGEWTTVDLTGADINSDLKRGIPLEDSSVTTIYTSHLLEHIPYHDLLKFIGECRRVLKPGGELSVCVPNARYFIELYMRQETCPRPMYSAAIIDTGSFLDQVNYVAYMNGEHHYMFDESNLVNTLKKGGFENVQPRAFDPALDIEARDYCSIYAVATK